MDQFTLVYSAICECWWLMRIPAWAIELAGDAGYWRNDDGEEYAPIEMATIVSTHDTRAEAEAALANVKVSTGSIERALYDDYDEEDIPPQGV